MKKLLWVSLFLLLFVSVQVEAQTPGNGQLIRLQAGEFDPLSESEPLPPAGWDVQVADSGGPYFIVQFNGPVESSWLAQVEQVGGTVLGYIPDNAHIVRIAPADVAALKTLPPVRWVGAYRPAYKLSPTLSNEVGIMADQVELLVIAFPGEPLVAVETFLINLGGTVIDKASGSIGLIFRITIQRSLLSQVAQNPAISWIERYEPPQLSNDEARKIMEVETIWQDFGYYGAGQKVAVSDSGLSVQNNLSADFSGRLVRAFSPSEMNPTSPQCLAKTTWTDLNGHGTHVAGSVLGNGVLSGSTSASHQYTTSFAGAAPEAQLVFMALNTDGSGGIQCIDLDAGFLAKGYQEGARISSNSWGGGANGNYNIISQLVDNYLWQHKDYTVLFAAGNAGPFASSIGSPGTAKNVITVGATENNRPDQDEESDDPDTTAGFSSRGPTADGRIKPDIVAPGTWILSSRAAQAPDSSFWGPFNANYAFMGGTSMATPLTAGAAALVREWLGKERNMVNPSGALLKALLIHGARPLPGAGAPDFSNGWGRIALKNTLGDQNLFIDDHQQGLSTGQSVTYHSQVVGGTPLHVTLVWTDPPAVPAASKTLVNNLDLVVQGPNGTIFGNGGSSPDTINNVEAVRLDAPASGTYTITVQAQAVNGQFGSQPFALVGLNQQNPEADIVKVYLPLIIK